MNFVLICDECVICGQRVFDPDVSSSQFIVGPWTHVEVLDSQLPVQCLTEPQDKTEVHTRNNLFWYQNWGLSGKLINNWQSSMYDLFINLHLGLYYCQLQRFKIHLWSLCCGLRMFSYLIQNVEADGSGSINNIPKLFHYYCYSSFYRFDDECVTETSL